MSYYPKSESYVKSKIKVELSLPNLAARSEVKMQLVLIHQNLLKKLFSDIKLKFDKLDIDNMETVGFDLSNLSDVVKNGTCKINYI